MTVHRALVVALGMTALGVGLAAPASADPSVVRS